jgi:hypothetical protein
VLEMMVKNDVFSCGDGMARGYCRRQLKPKSFSDGYGKSANPFRPKFNGSKVL